MTFARSAPRSQPRIPLALCVLASVLLHGALLFGLKLPSPSAPLPLPSVQIRLAGVVALSGGARGAYPSQARALPERLPVPETAPQEQPAKSAPAVAAAGAPQPPRTTPVPAPDHAPPRLAASSPLALARAVAQAAANAAPVPTPLGLNETPAQNKDFAYYLDAWRREVERVGQLNYPAEARAKKLAGTLRLRVTIAADGHLKDVRITESSGHAVLDDAALRIVRLAAPYAPFSPTMRAVAEVLEIERSWQFRNSTLST